MITRGLMKGALAVMLITIAVAESHAGGSCVVAKELGNSLDIEWVADPVLSQSQARQAATAGLLERTGRRKYVDVFPQAGTSLDHGHLMIVRTRYKAFSGKDRTSYGCGFSSLGEQAAEQAAVQDLRNFSWGWKPGFGYEVVERVRF